MKNIGSWLLRVLKGALIGVGAILPGISGGVLCVVMGIYRPMMAFLAHPIQQFKEKIGFFLPVLVGFVIGVLGLSRAVDWLFRTSPTPAIWLFIGLIVGTVPQLYQEAGQQGRGKPAWIALISAFAVMLAFLLIIKRSGNAVVTPNLVWWLICGVLWGVGLIVPGMSPSSLFIFLGLYQPMSAGIANLDMAIILPIAAGLLLTVALLAKGMQALITKRYAVTMHAVLGVTLASTLVIIPLGQAAGFWDVALYAGCFLIGLIVALMMSRASAKIDKTDK